MIMAACSWFVAGMRVISFAILEPADLCRKVYVFLLNAANPRPVARYGRNGLGGAGRRAGKGVRGFFSGDLWVKSYILYLLLGNVEVKLYF